MKQHLLDSYKDGFVTIAFCRICGQEKPFGECLGDDKTKIVDKEVDKPKKQD